MVAPTFPKPNNFSQIKSESRWSSGDACEKCGSTPCYLHRSSIVPIVWKIGHTIHNCDHRFDINFQGYTSKNSSSLHNTSNSNNQMQAMVVSPASKNSKTWFFDTGATHHLAQDIETLFDVQAYKENEQVIVGNGKKLPILHTGSKFFSSTFRNFHLKKVYHVSHLTTNLISVSKFCTDNNVFF